MKSIFFYSIFIILSLIGVLFIFKSEKIPSTTPLKLYLPEYFPKISNPPTNPLSIEGVELGRFLFYDSSLSKNGTVSCASCHQQSKAFSDGLKRSLGMNGQKTDFGAPSLTNVAYVEHLTWEGHDNSLEMQALKPLVRINEMDQRFVIIKEKLSSSKFYKTKFRRVFGTSDINIIMVAKALAQFQRTLISSTSKYDLYLQDKAELTRQEKLGLQLFSTIPDPENGIRGAGCINCHKPPLFTSPQKGYGAFSNNGLYSQPWAGLIRHTENENDLGKFRIPTLRNIEVTAPYMHLGIFDTLDEVLNHYSDGIQYSKTLDSLLFISNKKLQPGVQLGLRLTEVEKEAIVAFLKTLTDHEFLNNKSLSNPFL